MVADGKGRGGLWGECVCVYEQEKVGQRLVACEPVFSGETPCSILRRVKWGEEGEGGGVLLAVL